MSEQEKKSVAPGLVKSAGYSKPKSITINKTLQTVVEELPVTEKTAMFTEYYAEVMSESNWIPPQGELKITSEMLIVDANSKTDNNNDKRVKVQKAKKFEKPKPKEDIIVTDAPKVIDKLPTDMELVLNNSAMLNDIKQATKQTTFEIPTDFKSAEINKPQPEKVNMFGELKNTPVVENDKSKEDKETLVKEKPFMRIDNVEIRVSTDSDGNRIYMVGKKVHNREKFAEYLQEIGGKILAADCKRVDIKDSSYQLQPNGSYKDQKGRTLSVDDMLALVNEK